MHMVVSWLIGVKSKIRKYYGKIEKIKKIVKILLGKNYGLIMFGKNKNLGGKEIKNKETM